METQTGILLDNVFKGKVHPQGYLFDYFLPPSADLSLDNLQLHPKMVRSIRTQTTQHTMGDMHVDLLTRQRVFRCTEGAGLWSSGRS
jgi:hypothetical protein